MSILDIRENNWNTSKTLIAYSAITVLAFIINKIYGLFGHGVEAASMTWMFLYPLIGGMVYFFIVRILFSQVNILKGCRVFYNLHNTGIALLTVGSLGKGIMEIAGTSSNYTKIFFISGWSFILAGIIILIILKLSQQKNKLAS